MADVLRHWLQEAGVDARDLEQDFANGYLFGKLLHQYNLQPDLPSFVDKGKPDAFIKNYVKLQPTLTKLGVQLDTRVAQSLINKEPGLAAKVLYSIKQALDGMDKNFQALEHTGKTIQQFGLRTSPTRGLLDSQNFKSQQTAYQSGNLKFFEDVMRKKSQSPNAMMESLHLKKFADEGSRQAAAATEGRAADKAYEEMKQAMFRESERNKLAAARNDKANRLNRDEAIHAALLKHQDDRERQELRVEMALSELSHHKQQTRGAAAAADAAAGIDAFEMTLKRLGAEGCSEEVSGDTAAQGESPVTTLNRIRTFAPAAAKLAESGEEYLATIKARRQEEVAGRKEREARRKKLVVEQQAARTAAECRLEADSLLEVLVRQSAEEQKLGQRLWQLRQEKAAMEADRQLREEQYAARREKDWEESIRREIELHRSMKAQHDAATQQELATWREQQQTRAAVKAAARRSFASQVAWQLIQLAERVIEYRAATAGQQVPRRDWRAWLALFRAGDPSLGSPVLSQGTTSKEAADTQHIANTAELQDFLARQGEWCPDAPSSRPATAGTAAAAPADVAKAADQQCSTLGRLVAELAALAQKLRGHPSTAVPAGEQSPTGHAKEMPTAAAVAAALQVDAAAQIIRSIPLKIAVAGGPYAGKSTVARALADRFGLKLLVPGQLVANAAAAAQAWEQQEQQLEQQQQQQLDGAEQQTQDLVAPAAARQEPPMQVVLGQKVLQQLQQGAAVSDGLLVQLLLLAMVEAKDYTALPPEPVAVDTKAAKGGKAGKGDTPTATANKAAAITAVEPAAPAVPLPAHLATGAPGRGFVIDGFPSTEAQAKLLEKSLTQLDTTAEQSLVDEASVVAPPPLDALPQLQRPLRSGLDAVLLLGCDDESLAVKRALGRRLDPVTGHIYHLDFDPPPSSTPGLAERLVEVSGPDNDTQQVPQRLASYAAAAGPLSEWLTRFSTLRRPLDGSAGLNEVLNGAADILSGILVAKAAAHAAQTAAEAAQRAKESAEKARDFARAAQGHAEGAARELLAAKMAEIQAAALLNGSKNPDPASTEVLKAQAAAKCADQLKVCRVAATDAAHHAERADASSEQATTAVQRCKLAVGDAAVSADAEAAANKAAADAETAAGAAADAAKKAEAAKRLAEAYVAEAEKWFAASDVPIDAALPSAQQLSPAEGDLTEECSSSPAGAAATSLSATMQAASSSSNLRPLPSPAGLPAALVPVLHDEWHLLEHVYIQGMGRCFTGLREARHLALSHVAQSCSRFSAFLQRSDNKQQLLQAFIERFNAVELDMRKAKETQGELLLRSEELRDTLWAICDVKHEEADTARLKLANDGSAAEHVSLLGQHLTNLVQVELDRFLATCQFLFNYCHYSQNIFHPPGADKPLCPLQTSLAAATAETLSGKPDTAAKGAAPPAPYLLSLQQKLPQLAAALRAAGTAAAATHANALAAVEEASKRSAAAAASAAATANAAAAAAAAAASGQTPGTHRASAASAKGSTTTPVPTTGATGKASGSAAAVNTKLAASSEEAAAAAAAAAATVAALPDPAALAAVSALLQTVLAQELQLLQQRLALLGSKAAVIVDGVVQLQATANSQLAEWQQRRYVAECGAVAALEKVLKTAAAAGQPLRYDLRLEDEFLIVDESRLLIPPPPVQPPPRPASPALPPGVLSVQQLQRLAAALQQAAPGGFLQVTDAVEVMLKMASQGVLPSAWRDIDATHMTAAMAILDPIYSGYVEWRELLLSLAAASIPAIHTATAAQVAAQAAALAGVDGDEDGCLTLPEFEGVTWWFEPKPEAVQAAQEVLAAAAAARQQEGQGMPEVQQEIDVGSRNAGSSSQWAEDVLREAERCQAFKQLLWELFKQELLVPVRKPAVITAAPTVAPTQALPSSPKSGSKSSQSSQLSTKPGAAGSTAGSERASQSESGVPAASFTSSSSVDTVPGTPAEVCCSTAVLLYLCADRDLYQGISKAVAAAARSAAAGAVVDAASLVQMCYPLLTPEQAAPIQRAPLTVYQIAAAVSAAATAEAAAVLSAPAVTGAHAPASNQSASGQAAAVAQQGAAPAAIKASQLMYSAACERVVTLLLARYQWKDVYTATRL